MKNNETGETELVLGNRQLLSGFFVVVVLFALFFVMGYIVGRNSTPSAQTSASQTSGGAVPSSGRPAATGSAPAPQNPPAASEPVKEDSSPAREPPAQPVQQPATRIEPPSPAPAAAAEPVPGENYLQAYSGKQDVAETVAKTLREKGFATSLSPGPQGKTRVLVGPFPDLAKLGQAKADLERLGFAPFRQKIEK